MKKMSGVVAIVAAAILVTSVVSEAQDRGRGGRGQPDRAGPVDRDRMKDRDQLQDRRKAKDQDRVRDRDRLHVQDFSQLQDGEIYGSELMTARERNQYRERLQQAPNAEAREQVRAEHQQQMQLRAKERGVSLKPTSEGPIYGRDLMSLEERNQFRAQIREAGSEEERRQIMAQHREEIQARAKARGVDAPEETEEAE